MSRQEVGEAGVLRRVIGFFRLLLMGYSIGIGSLFLLLFGYRSILRIFIARPFCFNRARVVPEALKLCFLTGRGAQFLGSPYNIAHFLASNKKATRRWLVLVMRFVIG
ncbi:hypothetical protein WS54_07125 [Burkholderia sp. NRF60-BP8]|nr:hypothetical protein WS54_07125 [Burkholderia sp. NRF60-BP8]